MHPIKVLKNKIFIDGGFFIGISKKKILVQNQGRTEFQTAGIL